MGAGEIVIVEKDIQKDALFLVPIGKSQYFVNELEALKIIETLSAQIVIKRCQT